MLYVNLPPLNGTPKRYETNTEFEIDLTAVNRKSIREAHVTGTSSKDSIRLPLYKLETLHAQLYLCGGIILNIYLMKI